MNPHRWRVLWFACFLFLGGVRVEAKETAGDQRVGIALGWQSTWIIRIVYGRAVDLSGEVEWVSELTVPLFAEGFLRNGSLLTGLSIPIPRKGEQGLGFRARGMTGFLWSGDDLGFRLSWGGEGRIATGWYEKSWSIAAEMGYRAALVTLMWHSEVQQRCFTDRFPGDDGWGPAYSLRYLTSQRASIGVAAELTASENLSLSIRGGFENTPSRVPGMGTPPIFPLPFYVEAGGTVSW